MFRKNKVISNFYVAAFIGWKSILYRKVAGILIIAIIGLGFLSTNFSAGVVIGLKTAIEDKVRNNILGNVLIEPGDGRDSIDGVASIEKRILSLPQVVAVSPHKMKGVTFVDAKGSKVSAQLIALDPRKESLVTTMKDRIVSGRYLSEGSEGAVPEVVLGSDLTNKYRLVETPSIDVDSGENVLAIFDNGQMRTVKVRGIYAMKLVAVGTFSYISLEDAKRIYNFSDEEMDSASAIVVKTLPGTEKEVVEALLSMGVPGKIHQWHEKLGMLNQFTDSLLIISKITSIIGVLIAFSTVYIMIYINVMQKKSQIGMLKAIGITEDAILLSYLFQSMVYGLLGGAFGLALTRTLVEYFSAHPIPMPMADVVPLITAQSYGNSFALLACSSVVAGYFACRGVIKMNILEAIFGE